MSVNEREEPAPAITAADIGFLRDMATDWNAEGEISEKYGGVDEERGGIWRKNTESCRRLSAHASRLADVLESFAGRSPAEVPPNWPEEVQEAQKDYAAKLDRMIVCCEVLEEVEETEGLDAETIQNARDNALFATAEHQRTLDVLLAAVWRSAQPHD